MKFGPMDHLLAVQKIVMERGLSNPGLKGSYIEHNWVRRPINTDGWVRVECSRCGVAAVLPDRIDDFIEATTNVGINPNCDVCLIELILKE